MQSYFTSPLNRSYKLLTLFIFALASLSSAAQDNTIEVNIDSTKRFQTIDHFGASDCWSMQHIGGWSEPNRSRVADLLFSTTKGIGLSGWRFNIGAGINRDRIPAAWRTAETFEISEGQYDWNRQKEEQWFLHAAKARGVSTFVGFANSPPARMTRNGFTNASHDVGTTNLKEGYEAQYATYLVDILDHFRNHPNPEKRIPFGWVSPINEPQWDWDESWQEGNRASNQDIKSVVLALSKEIKKRNLNMKVLAVESGESIHLYGPFQKSVDLYGAEYGNYLTLLTEHDELRQATGNVISSHGYFSDTVKDRLVARRTELREVLDQYPNWTYWQTEYCVMQGSNNEGGGGRDLTMNVALDVARIIHLDLAVANASAWNWWTSVSPEDYKDGLIYTNYKKPGDEETIILPKLLWAYGQFSRFIRPGARRIEMSGADDIYGLLGSAYVNSDGSQVLVFINMSDEPQTAKIQFDDSGSDQNLSTTEFYETSKNRSLERVPLQSGDGLLVVPGRSIQTLIRR